MAPCSLPRADFAAPHLLDHGGCADHQHAAQGLVAGAGDRSEPGFASCRVILWGQPDPRREISAGSEGLRLADFHDQQRGPDRPDAGDLRQASAGFILAVPGHQLGFDRLQLRLQLGIFRGVLSKQLACQCGQHRLGLQTRQQRFDLVDAARRDQPKLRRIAANRIGQLGALADQPVARAGQHLRCLLFGGLGRDEPPCRPAHRLAQRLGVRRVVLAALDVGFGPADRRNINLVTMMTKAHAGSNAKAKRDLSWQPVHRS